MLQTHTPYPAEFRQQMVELVRAGRTPAELSREFQVTAQTILNRVGQAARDAGQALSSKKGLSTAEREGLAGCVDRSSNCKRSARRSPTFIPEWDVRCNEPEHTTRIAWVSSP